MMKDELIQPKCIGALKLCGQSIKIYLSDFKLFEDELGSFSPRNSCIFLSANQSAEQMLTTLIHECLHLIFTEYEMDKTEDLKEELIVGALDTPICQNLIRDADNRKMFDRIVSGEFIGTGVK